MFPKKQVTSSISLNTPFKFFIKGQFNYCPLLWMFCSRSSNNLINKIHERALSLTAVINDIPFNELPSINSEVSIQKKKIIKTLLIEVYKNLNGLLPPIMFDLFTTREILKLFKEFKKLWKRKPSVIALRPSHTRQLSYGNYFRMILKTLQY